MDSWGKAKYIIKHRNNDQKQLYVKVTLARNFLEVKSGTALKKRGKRNIIFYIFAPVMVS